MNRRFNIDPLAGKFRPRRWMRSNASSRRSMRSVSSVTMPPPVKERYLSGSMATAKAVELALGGWQLVVVRSGPWHRHPCR
jgi:hypothetical protein